MNFKPTWDASTSKQNKNMSSRQNIQQQDPNKPIIVIKPLANDLQMMLNNMLHNQ